MILTEPFAKILPIWKILNSPFSFLLLTISTPLAFVVNQQGGVLSPSAIILIVKYLPFAHYALLINQQASASVEKAPPLSLPDGFIVYLFEFGIYALSSSQPLS